jgi:hypothetical protein
LLEFGLNKKMFQIRDIFISLDDSGDRLIDFEEFKVIFSKYLSMICSCVSSGSYGPSERERLGEGDQARSKSGRCLTLWTKTKAAVCPTERQNELASLFERSLGLHR